MPPLARNILCGLLLALFGLSTLLHLRAMRNWRRRLRQVAEGASEEERVKFMQTDEYQRLRKAARTPILAATLLILLLYAVMRVG